jgi:uncharacterized membrane protein YraQ (UPF0718 family)
MNAIIYISLCVLLCGVSFILDRKRTLEGIKKGLIMFRAMLLPFLNILVLVSLMLFVIPPEVISRYLGPESGLAGYAVAAVVGAVIFIPPFISYPIAAGLLQQGASYAVVATFMTTLIMVGVLALPIEIRYFGRRVAILRNILNFTAAIVVGLVIGLIM